MNEQKQLALAIKIASEVHYGQFDRGKKPYILHPLHLMNQLLFDTQLATIAVLHDVIEDLLKGSKTHAYIDLTLDGLLDLGFSVRVVSGLEKLTHDPDDDYPTYINKMYNNYDAIRAKRKDLEHNSDITRLKGVTEKDLERIEKYHKAFIMLGEFKRKFEK